MSSGPPEAPDYNTARHSVGHESNGLVPNAMTERQELLYQHISANITSYARRADTMPATSEPSRPVRITGSKTLALDGRSLKLNEHELTLLNLFRLTGEQALTIDEITALGFHLYAEPGQGQTSALYRAIQSLGEKLTLANDRQAGLVNESGLGATIVRWTHNYRFIDTRATKPDEPNTLEAICQDILQEVRATEQPMPAIRPDTGTVRLEDTRAGDVSLVATAFTTGVISLREAVALSLRSGTHYPFLEGIELPTPWGRPSYAELFSHTPEQGGVTARYLGELLGYRGVHDFLREQAIGKVRQAKIQGLIASKLPGSDEPIVQDAPKPETVVPAEYLTAKDFAELYGVPRHRVYGLLKNHPEIPRHTYIEARQHNVFIDGATAYTLRRTLKPEDQPHYDEPIVQDAPKPETVVLANGPTKQQPSSAEVFVQAGPAPETVVPPEYLTGNDFAELTGVAYQRVKKYLDDHPEVTLRVFDEAKRNAFLDGATVYALRKALVAPVGSVSIAVLAQLAGTSVNTAVRHIKGTVWENQEPTKPTDGNGRAKPHYPPEAVDHVKNSRAAAKASRVHLPEWPEVEEPIVKDAPEPSVVVPAEYLTPLEFARLEGLTRELLASHLDRHPEMTLHEFNEATRNNKFLDGATVYALRKALRQPRSQTKPAAAENTEVGTTKPEQPVWRPGAIHREEPFRLESRSANTTPLKSPASGSGSAALFPGVGTTRQPGESKIGLPAEPKKRPATHRPETPGSWRPAIPTITASMFISRTEQLTARQIAKRLGVQVEAVEAAAQRIDPGDEEPQTNDTNETIYKGSALMTLRQQLIGIPLEHVQRELDISPSQLPRVHAYLGSHGFEVFGDRISPGAFGFLSNNLAAATQQHAADDA